MEKYIIFANEKCITTKTQSKMKDLTLVQIEQKKQLFAQKKAELQVLHDELVELGVLELSDNFLAKVTGGVPGGKKNFNPGGNDTGFPVDFEIN